MEFGYLFEKYKMIYKNNRRRSFKNLQVYEKVFLILLILSGLLVAIFATLNMVMITGISALMMLVVLAVLIIIRNNPKEQKRYLSEELGSIVNNNMKDLVELLSGEEFQVKIDSQEELDRLIQYAKEEADRYDYFKDWKTLFSAVGKYLLLPATGIFIAEYLKGVNYVEIIKRAVIFIFWGCIISIAVQTITMDIIDILNPEKKWLKCFIRDMEELKVFSNKAKQF